MHFLRDGQPLVYDLQGAEGPVVVALAGMGDLRSTWRHVVPGLVAAGLRVVTLDLRGHGASGTGFTRFDPPAVAGDVLALLDHLGADRAVVIGNSSSGGAAVWAALDAPDRVFGIGLIGPVVRPAGAPNPWLARVARWLFLPRWGAWLWGRFYRTLFKGGRPDDLDDHVARVVEALRDPRRRHAMLENGLQGKPGDRIADVRCPVLVLMGTADPDFPDATAEAQAIGAALRAEVVLLDGVGHYPHQERPLAVVDAVVGLVRSACPAPA